MTLDKTMKKYLVPLDGSEIGEAALPWAKFLSEKTGLGIELMRCHSPLAALYTYPDFATPPPVPFDLSGIVRQSEKYLNLVIESRELANSSSVVIEGEPASAILEHSKKDDVEAILLSSHGVGGLGKWLLGSVSTKVVRGSRKPVIVVRSPDGEAPEPKLNRILVCLDGSELAELALEPALNLARQFSAELVLYRGVSHLPYPMANIQVAVNAEMATSREYLAKIQDRYPDDKIDARCELSLTGEGIMEASKDCDMIVMTSHGRGGFKRWLLGSVTESVLHRSDKPMMIIFGKDES